MNNNKRIFARDNTMCEIRDKLNVIDFNGKQMKHIRK